MKRRKRRILVVFFALFLLAAGFAGIRVIRHHGDFSENQVYNEQGDIVWSQMEEALPDVEVRTYFHQLWESDGSVGVDVSFVQAAADCKTDSKGGLDARYLISGLHMAPYVASLTTINTPHRGSMLVEFLKRLPDGVYYQSFASLMKCGFSSKFQEEDRKNRITGYGWRRDTWEHGTAGA